MSFIVEKEPWKPHDYQIRAMKMGVELGAAGLLLDPGLGKTSISLGIFTALQASKHVRSMLVIAPLRPCYLVWPAEVSKWKQFSHLKVVVLHGKDKDELAKQHADIYIINPDGLKWFVKNRLHERLPVDMLVVDESTKFKNPSTTRFRLLESILNTFQRRYILTGTPASNGLIDLFGQIYILDHGAALGRYITHYRQRYFMQDAYGGSRKWNPQLGANSAIADRISGFTLRLNAEDYIKLPELVFNRIIVDLPHEVKRVYKELEDDYITLINEEEVTALTAATASIKLRQICNGSVYNAEREVVSVHTQKSEALHDLREEIQGAPLLTFYQFKHDLEGICEYFGEDVPYIGSGVSNKLAERLCRQFNDGTIPLLLAHPDSVGHGLNLQGRSNHLAFYALPWSLEHRHQAIRRVYRQGNPNTHVFVHDILARGTIDMHVHRVLNEKEATEANFLGLLKQSYQEAYNG